MGLQHSGTSAVKLKFSMRIPGSTLLNYMQRSHILFYWLKGHSKAVCVIYSTVIIAKVSERSACVQMTPDFTELFLFYS